MNADARIPRWASRLAAVLVGWLLMLCCAGCATIAHGRVQDVTVSSEPPGAEVFVNDRPVGITPTTIRVKRRESPIVLRFEKSGFTKTEISLTRTISRWIAADLALSLNPLAAQGLDSPSQWPLMAAQALAWTAGIDYLTGAAFTHPSAVRAVLSPAGSVRSP